MSVPEDQDKKQNVVRLGTETLFAIAEQLRRMYDADLRTKPSEKLERLMRRIEDHAAAEEEILVRVKQRKSRGLAETHWKLFLHLGRRRIDHADPAASRP